MKPEIFKGIFALAVRLLGLFFLYLGLSAITPLLDVGAIETAARSDIITAVLPIAFNLSVAWWLLGGSWLIRRAYPDARRFPNSSHTKGQSSPTAEPDPHPKADDLDVANQKLQSLVENPRRQ